MFSFGRKRGSRNLSFLIIFLFLLIIISGFALFKFFTIKKIEISQENLKCLEGVNIENESNLSGKIIFLVSQQKVETDFKKKYFCIESVVVSKKPPSKVNLKISGKKPVLELILNKKSLFNDFNLSEATASTQEAVLKVEPNPDMGRAFLVDSDGQILAKASGDGDLQKVEFVKDNLEVGERIDKSKMANAILIFEKLKLLSLPITRAIIDGDILFIENKPQLFFSLNGDPVRQSASLQLILQKAKMDSKEMDKIDLRFDKIVVVYSPKKR